MKEKICIVELYNHHEVVNALCTLYLYAGYDVAIFAEKKVIDNIRAVEFDQFIKSSKESQKGFITRHSGQLQKADLVIFTTIVKHPKFFAQFNFSAPIILLIHDGNFYLRPKESLKIIGLRTFARWLKFWVCRESKYRIKLLQKVSFISFADDFIADYLSKEILVNNLNVLPALPLSFFEGQSPHYNPIQIIIPGSIQPTRDYLTVISAFKQIQHLITQPIEIILLGSGNSSFGQNTISQFRELAGTQIKIIAQKHSFSQEDYDQYLAQARLAIIPIKQDFVGGIFKEKYGKTKITGSINDVIRFGTPTFISSHYPFPADLSKLFTPFTNSLDLQKHILEHLETAKIHPISNLENYRLEERSKKLAHITNLALKKRKLH